VLRSLEPSIAFDVACAGLKNGNPSIAATLLAPLRNFLETEAHDLWIQTLWHAASAEQLLTAGSTIEWDMAGSTRSAVVHFEKAGASCMALEACTGSPRVFARWYLQARNSSVRILSKGLYELHRFKNNLAQADSSISMVKEAQMRGKKKLRKYCSYFTSQKNFKISKLSCAFFGGPFSTLTMARPRSSKSNFFYLFK